MRSKLSLGDLALTRKLSKKQKFQLLTEFTQSVHWTHRIASLRTNLMNNPGDGEVLFAQQIKSLGPLFHYIRQWPHFVSSQYGTQYFFIDFFFPKLKLCVEIDGNSHLSEPQKQWDNWRTCFIQDHDLSVLRYTSNNLSLSEFLSDVVISAPVKFRDQLVCIYNKYR